MINPNSTATPLTSLVVVELAGAGGVKREISLYAVVRAAPEKKPGDKPASAENASTQKTKT